MHASRWKHTYYSTSTTTIYTDLCHQCKRHSNARSFCVRSCESWEARSLPRASTKRYRHTSAGRQDTARMLELAPQRCQLRLRQNNGKRWFELCVWSPNDASIFANTRKWKAFQSVTYCESKVYWIFIRIPNEIHDLVSVYGTARQPVLPTYLVRENGSRDNLGGCFAFIFELVVDAMVISIYWVYL